MTTALAPERYLDLLKVDADRLLDVARRGVDAEVPPCPGWSVGDLVQHVGVVYLHKVECMRRNAAPPEPWPPPEVDAREPLGLMGEALGTLITELRQRGTDSPSATWWPPDQTSGFWYRRMAQETAVHRVDAELAHDDVTPIDPGLAIDGVDEILAVMLRAEWASGPEIEHAVDGRIRVTTGGRSWTATVGRDDVRVTLDDAGDSDPVDVTISGEPHEVLLWLWGRLGDDAVTFTGDHEVAAALRRRLAETD